MQIALIGSARFPASPPFAGGLEAHTWCLAQGLRSRGHDVTVFDASDADAFQPSESSRQDVAAGPVETLRDHHVHLRALRSIATSGRFDVVHNNSTHHLPIAMAPLLGVPMVTTLHCPPTPWLESALALGADEVGTIVSVSASNAASWRHVVFADVVHNGVDVDRWAPTGARRHGAAWIGRLVPEKAPHLAIAAARRADLPLRLAGPIHDRTYFDDHVRPLLGGSIEYVGHLDVAGVVDVVASSIVALVTPMWAEPFGLVVIEALACGTPVAGFGTGALPEILGSQVGRLVAAGDVPALADAAIDASGLSNDECRRYVCERFSLDAMLDRYERILCEAAASTTRSGGAAA